MPPIQILENVQVIKYYFESMKPIVLHSPFIFLCLKSELKIFLFTETHEKGNPTYKWMLLE